MKEETQKILPEIERICEQLGKISPHSEEYQTLINRLSELIAIQELVEKAEKSTFEDKHKVLWRLLNNGPLVTGTLSLSGLTLLVVAELFGHLVTSKGLSFIRFK